MKTHFPAPELCQGADEELLIKMGAIIFPGFVKRNPRANGLELILNGDYKDESLLKTAADQFQLLLGILRAWRPIAGQRADEVRPGIGPGSIRDEHGNQLVKVGSATMYTTIGTEDETYAREARLASEHSPYLINALWLNGRRDRNAADFFMVYEFAKWDFHGRKAIIRNLGITNNDIRRLTTSANNLAPIDGGRHAKGSGSVKWGLHEQMVFIADLLKRWIAYRAHNAI